MSGIRTVILGVFFGVVLAAGLLLPPIQSYKIRRHLTQIHTEQNSVPSVSVMISTNAIARRQGQHHDSDWLIHSSSAEPKRRQVLQGRFSAPEAFGLFRLDQ